MSSNRSQSAAQGVLHLDRLLSRGMAVLHDLLMIPPAWLLAYWLRFNLEEIPEPFLSEALWGLLLLIPIQALIFWRFGLYRGVWRFASLPDLVRITKAVLSGLLIGMAALYLVNGFAGVPRSVPIIHDSCSARSSDNLR